MNNDTAIKELHTQISERVFVTNEEEQIDLFETPNAWVFDFRRLLLEARYANLVADIFFERFKDRYPFQLCSLEVAGVPLMTAIMMKFYERGYTDINSFFVRKSRKKTNLMRMIEGTPKEELPVVLVDDLINSGNSFWRQIEALDERGLRITTVWAVLRFRDPSYYKRFTNRGIEVASLFELNDFSAVLGENVQNLAPRDQKPPVMPFTAEWIYRGPDPSYSWVVQKSQPLIDDTRLYVGMDDERFRAINQSDGSLVWEFTTGRGVSKKSIFSDPQRFKELIIFGAYDGTVYALDRHTGERRWSFIEGDWVGSSPAVAHDLGMVFIGLEFGLFTKHGGIVALDAASGKKVWGDYTHPALTHGTPCYIRDWRQVAIGSNDGVARLYDAKSGTKLWEFTTFGGASYDPKRDDGFGMGDIKCSFVYDKKRDHLIFGSIDGFLYIIERKTGYLVHHYKCDFGIWSDPCIHNDRVYFSSVDKHLRCMDLETHEIRFDSIVDGTRIFSSPTVIEGRLYIGTNAGRLHELDPETGDWHGYFQATERITNSVVYNPKTDRYFLPTYANQILCLKRNEDKEK